jgi:Mg2+ and Co2+ transporter CorA
VEQLIAQNSSRISENLKLITSVMTVREGGMLIKQSQTLGVLTFVATVVLPFNLVAAIPGMQTGYEYSQPQSGGSEPSQKKPWIFWVASIGAFFCIWAVFGLYKFAAIHIRTSF